MARLRGLLAAVLILALVATLPSTEQLAGKQGPTPSNGAAHPPWWEQAVRSLLGGAPGSVPAQATSGGAGLPVDEPPPEGKVWPAERRERELTGARTAHSRVFALADGRTQAEVSAVPVHYRDSNGQYQPIDTSVKPAERAGFAVGNSTNTFTSLFGASSDRLARFERDGRHIELGLPGGAKPLSPRVDGSTVTYASAVDGADLVYRVTATAMKESIVLHAAPSGPATYVFTVDTGDLVADRRSDGSIAFVRPAGGEPVAVMPPPFMHDDRDDAASPYGKAWSDRVSQKVSQLDGKTVVTVAADEAWLRDPARRYPVVIDPTIKVQPVPADGQDVQIYSGATGTNYNNTYQLSVGTDSAQSWRSLVKFPLTGVPAGTQLDAARLEMYYSQTHTAWGFDVAMEARRVTQPWSESTATWANMSGNIAAAPAGNSVQVDDGDAGTSVVGTWPFSSNPSLTPLAINADYRFNNDATTGHTHTWVPTITESGDYQVEVHFVAESDRASNAPYTVHHAGGSTTYQVDQTGSPLGVWKTLGVHPFVAGTTGRVVLGDVASKAVIADAVRFTRWGVATKQRAVSSVWSSFPVRNVVQEWVNGTQPNHGFMIKAVDESPKGRGGPIFEGAEYFYQNAGRDYNLPRLILTWGRPGVSLQPPTTITATGAALSWSAYADPSPAPGDNIVEYQVHRSLRQTFVPSAATLVAPLPSGTLSYQDTSGSPTPADTPDTELGHYYYYMVAVKTADGEVIAAPTQGVRLPKAGHITRVYRAGTVDTTLSQSQPNTNVDVYDGDPYVSPGNNSTFYGDTRGLVKFPALTGIPAGAQVSDARLRMWATSVFPGTVSDFIDVHRLTRAFGETTATWNKADATTFWTAPGGDYHPAVLSGVDGLTNDPEWQRWDVKPAVDAWLASPSSNHGLLLKMHDEAPASARAMLLSSESVDPMLGPTLEVTYLEPTAASTYHAPYTPARMIPGDLYTIDVTVSNPTLTTWTVADWELSYHWALPDGTDVTNGGNQVATALPRNIVPGDAVEIAAGLRTPIQSAEGNKRTNYVLRWELHNKTTGQWLSATTGIASLDQNVAVEDPTSNQLGLEKFYQYLGENTGAGGSLMNNLFAGNVVWSYDAWSNPSRGLSTFVRLAYNSLDTSDTVAGFGFSLQASTLTRLGTPLDFHPNPNPTTVTLTDGDGTSHVFSWDPGTSKWVSPKGVHLFLQRQVVCDPNTKDSRAWVLTRPDRTRFYFDCEGYLSAIRDNNVNELLFTYEERKSNNKPVKFLRYITDPLNRQTLTVDYWAKGDAYDLIDDATWTKVTGLSNLTNPKIIDHVRSIVDISGRRMTFTYTDKGLLGELIDGAGSAQPKVFAFRYDMTQGNKNVKLIRVTDPRGNATLLDYYSRPEDDPKFKWWTKTVTDRLGQPTTFGYTDPDGQAGSTIRTVATDAENHPTTSLMDGFGRPVEVTDAKSQTSKLAWDADNNVTRLEEPNGAFASWTYDPNTGYPLTIKDAEANANNTPGTVLAYQTQLEGHVADLIEKTTPEGRKWAFSYTLEGDLASAVDPLGTASADPNDFTTTYTYDTFGQMLTARDANGNVTTNSRFDNNGYPQTITDALGKSTDFVYDVRGQVTTVTDALLKHTTQTYDTFGRPLVNSVPKDEAGGVFIVTPAPLYDANDNVVRSTAANGAVTTTTFDANDQVSFVLDPVDTVGGPQRKTSFTYDRVGNVLTSTEPNGNLTPDPTDFVTTNAYDEIYQLVSVTDAQNHRTTYEYDNVGNQVTMIDPRKNATPDPTDYTKKFAYDRAHRMLRATDALGKVTTTAYDRDGLVVSTTDQLGNTTQTTRDRRGMVTEMKVPHKNVSGTITYRITRYEYDQVGNRTKEISPRGVVTTDDPDDFALVTVYDALNRVKETLSPFDRDDARYNTPDRTTYTYDEAGRMTQVSAPPSSGETVRNNTNYTYFDNAWTKSATDPWNIVTAYDYNEIGSQTLRTITSAGGSSSRTMTWQYFPDGKLKSRADDGVPVGKHVVLVDNSDFNNTSSTGTWATATTGPGLFGHNYRTHAAGSGVDTFTWGLNIPQDGTYEVFIQYPQVSGAATNARFTVVHPAGSTVVTVNQTVNTGVWVSLGSFAFTEGNAARITLSDQAGGTVVADAVKLVRNNSGETDTERYDYVYAYDANGNQTTITDNSPTARVDRFTVAYTGLNQVDTVREFKLANLLNTTTFTYNENGAPATAQHDKQHSTFGYDVRDLLAQVTSGKFAGDPAAKTTRFTYTDRGERAQQVKGNGNTVTHEYYLDGLLRTQTERKSNGLTLVAQHALEYDLNGNRTRDVTSKMNADNNSAYLNTTYDFGYDPRNRIVSLNKTGAGAGAESYTYDPNNNIIEQRINGVSTTYNYDRNRLLTASTSGVTAAYNYDPFGRLDTVTAAGIVVERNIYDGFDHVLENRHNNGTTTSTTRYTYDPWDRTATRTTGVGTPAAKTTTFNYLGLSTEVIEEAVGGTAEKSFYYTPFGERLLQLTRTAGGGEERAYYGYTPHSDVELLTNDAGNVTATYAYTAYGSNDAAQFTGLDKPDPLNPTKEPYNSYRYNGKRWDQAAGSYDMGFRDYSPGLNRYLLRDSYNGALADMRLGVNPWTSNRYSLGGGNPITMVELDGHCSINPLSWGDCAGDVVDAVGDAASATAGAVGDAAGWVADQADALWDATWEVGSDVVSGVGDFLGDVGEWIGHNAEALGEIALDALEVIGGVGSIIGGAALVVAGAGACLASTPLVATGVGAVATAGVCWGGPATAAGGIALIGLGMAMVVDGGSNLGEDAGKLENPPNQSGSSTPEPQNPKKRDDGWLKRNGVDPHEVKAELPGRGGYQDIYVDKNGNIYAVRKGTDPNDGEYVGNMRDFK
ncbi:MAG TPA: DNRLRE domain-containing protein [Candidatus Limnocylindrales bacterium]|nr:DNRLRE domain-containing protein [Candidatus Limnocylindrales bacterium]